MPPRQFENRGPEPEPHRWQTFDKEKNKKEESKEPDEKQEEKRSEKKTADNQRDTPKQEREPKKKELSPEEKRERRNEAIERSQSLKKQFEESPVPNDPSTVARLIIAEHILDIDEQLQNPEAFESKHAKEDLEASLDYMCNLAEKLEDPTIESPPYIQEAYETLLELTEESLQTADTPQNLVEEIAEALRSAPTGQIPTISEPITPAYATPQGQAPPYVAPAVKLSPAATNLLAHLHLVASRATVTPRPTASSQPHPSFGGGSSSTPFASSTPGGEYKKPSSQAIPGHNLETPPTNPTIHNAREYHVGMQPNITKPLAAIALASLAANAIHNSPEISHRHEFDPSTPSTPIPEKTAVFNGEMHPTVSRSHKEPTVHATTLETILKTSSQTFARSALEARTRTIEHKPRETTPPGGKLEHLSLPSLLSLAKDVNLGYGRYLKDEFEHGRIDRDGLIKVLKTRKKGLNFAAEFNTQAAHFRQRLESIEFITKPPKPSHTSTNDEETISAPTPIINESVESANQKEAFSHPILERFAHPEKSLFQPSIKSTIPINLITTILAVIVFGIIIFFLFLPT